MSQKQKYWYHLQKVQTFQEMIYLLHLKMNSQYHLYRLKIIEVLKQTPVVHQIQHYIDLNGLIEIL